MMQKMNTRSGFTKRPNRKTPMLAATMRPARRPTLSPPSSMPRYAVTPATPTTARADQNRAANGVGPAGSDESAISQ